MKKIASLVAVSALSIGITAVALPAQAAGFKDICNSANSYSNLPVIVYPLSGGFRNLNPGSCYTFSGNMPRVQVQNPSYRLAYNGGGWSACKTGNKVFTPANNGETYYKVYKFANCKNA